MCRRNRIEDERIPESFEYEIEIDELPEEQPEIPLYQQEILDIEQLPITIFIPDLIYPAFTIFNPNRIGNGNQEVMLPELPIRIMIQLPADTDLIPVFHIITLDYHRQIHSDIIHIMQLPALCPDWPNSYEIYYYRELPLEAGETINSWELISLQLSPYGIER